MTNPVEWLRQHCNRDTAIVVGALALGGVALYVADRYLEHQEGQLRATLTQQHTAGTTRVVVAAADLQPGSVISEQTVAVRAIPTDYVQAEAVRPERFDDVKGRHLSQPLEKGRALLFSYVVEGPIGFSDGIAPGRRALTLHVDEVSSINGLVRPGDRLDLLYTSRAASASVVRPLLSAVKVLATGAFVDATAAQDARRGGNMARTYSTITLEVAPDEAERVIIARETGQVTAMLRRRTGNGDDPAPPSPIADAAPARPRRVVRDTVHMPAPVRSERVVDYIMGGRGNGVPEYVRVPMDMAAHIAGGGAPPRLQPPPPVQSRSIPDAAPPGFAFVPQAIPAPPIPAGGEPTGATDAVNLEQPQ